MNSAHIVDALYNGEIGGGHSGVAHDTFCHAFVERHGKHGGVGKCVGDPVGIQKGRDKRLTTQPIHSLAEVEHEVPPLARRGEPRSGF